MAWFGISSRIEFVDGLANSEPPARSSPSAVSTRTPSPSLPTIRYW